ncbi:MAG TPA: hypothetical protein VK838_06250 [Candidatus Limnocylindrales bacterium]|nr:hypothetical protein [Candidatus Limnocylindrales bacterium]
MSQVNVNTPGDREPGPPVSDGSGYGMIVGILVGVLVVALVVWLLVFNGGGTTPDNNDNGGNGGEMTPGPSGGWRLIDAA